MTNLSNAYYNYGLSSSYTQAINWLQNTYGCCGVQSYSEWGSIYYSGSLNNIPSSCCVEQYKGCQSNVDSNVYSTGCYYQYGQQAVNDSTALGGIAVSFAAIGIIMGIAILAISVRRRSGNYN